MRPRSDCSTDSKTEYGWMYKTTVTPDNGQALRGADRLHDLVRGLHLPPLRRRGRVLRRRLQPRDGQGARRLLLPGVRCAVDQEPPRATYHQGSARSPVMSSSGSSFGRCESPGGSDRGSGRSRWMSTIGQCWRRSDASVSPDSRPPSCRSSRWSTAPGSGRRGSRGHTISGRIVRSRALRCCGRGPRRNPIQARPLRCASGSSRHSGACPG